MQITLDLIWVDSIRIAFFCYLIDRYQKVFQGDAAIDSGDFSEAIAIFDHAILLNSEDYYAHCRRGFAKHMLGLHHEAIKDFDKAINLCPHFYYSFKYRAMVKADLVQHYEAIKDFDIAMQLNPLAEPHPDPSLVLIGFNYLFKFLDYPEYSMLELFRSFLLYPETKKSLAEQRFDDYKNRGISKAKLGLHAEAVEDYSQAAGYNEAIAHAYSYPKNSRSHHYYLDYSQEHIDLYYHAAISETQLGLYADALESIGYAIQKFHGQYCRTVKVVYSKSRSDDYYSQFLDSNNPLHYNIFYQKAVLEAKIGNHINAIKSYSIIIYINPTADNYRARAASYMQIGFLADARDDYTAAIALNSSNADDYNHRAILHAELGQHTEAIVDFDKAEELDPLNFTNHERRSYSKKVISQHSQETQINFKSNDNQDCIKKYNSFEITELALEPQTNNANRLINPIGFIINIITDSSIHMCNAVLRTMISYAKDVVEECPSYFQQDIIKNAKPRFFEKPTAVFNQVSEYAIKNSTVLKLGK